MLPESPRRRDLHVATEALYYAGAGGGTAHARTRIGVGMDKLEEILRAEEAARRTVAEARDQAQARTHAAEADGRALLATELTAAHTAGAQYRESALRTAEERIRAVTSEAATRRSAAETEARARMDEVVSATVRELVG